MKKELLLTFAFVVILASAVYAQTVSTSELKTTLIDSIRDYLQSQTPRLEKNELKDLIVAYLTTSGDTVDLSKTGTYSNEKLETIYNKAKGTSPLAGWDRWDKHSYGYHYGFFRNPTLYVAAGQTRRGILPVGDIVRTDPEINNEIYNPSKDPKGPKIGRLEISIMAASEGYGAIKVKLTSPNGQTWERENLGSADMEMTIYPQVYIEKFKALGIGYQNVNQISDYYIPAGDWKVEVTGIKDSEMTFSWYPWPEKPA